VGQVARAIGSHPGISVKRDRKQGSSVLFVRSESQQGREFEINDVVVMGRSAETDVVIDDPYASEFHLRLVSQEGGMMLHDLGSTNGTYVNGRRISAPTQLRRGDTIQVGKTVMEIK
jgi:pSer/pThr/pTyr-binding forkhead associated (FHA) protein